MPSQAEIDARLARYRASKDARDLWPDVPVPAFRAAQQEVARVAGAVLAGAPAPVPLQLPPGVDAHALGVAASAGGMGPLLGYWSETARIRAEPAVAELLATHLDHGRRRAARLSAELDRIVVALADRGIEVMVLKGAHTAVSYFPEPGTRPMTDADVAVRPFDLPYVEAVLRDLGFDQDRTTVVPQRSHWHQDPAAPVRSVELTHADNPWTVDLHVTLDRESAGVTQSLGDVDPQRCDVLRHWSREIRVLPQPLLLAYLALHASFHFHTIPLLRLVEIVLVARADFSGRPDRWLALDQLLAGTGAGRFVFPALDLAERLAPGAVDAALLARVRAAAPPQLRRYMLGVTPGSAQRLHPLPLGDRYLWAASPRELARMLLDTVWPSVGGRLVSPRQVLRTQGRRLRWLLLWLRKTLS